MTEGGEWPEKRKVKSIVKGELMNSVRPLVGDRDGEVAGFVWALELATLSQIFVGSYRCGIGGD